MSTPVGFSDAIPLLNACVQQNLPGQLAETLKALFQSTPELASALIPAYAKYLRAQDFELLSSDFPALSPLLNGYRQVFALAS